MLRDLRPVVAVLANLVLVLSTTAQEPGIRWQQDIESAKVMAQQSGRLVLVHVVADGCGPCQSLEQSVFNQPGVAGAIDARFVPVKLNANEFPAIAQGFGITRVPTDVILTPQGQIIGKMISPATPAAYVAETTQVANQYASQPGQTYQLAAATPPQPPILNPAYADLPIGGSAQSISAAAATAANSAAAPPTSNYSLFAPPTTSTAPATVTNNYVPQAAATAPPQDVTPVGTNPAANPYAAYAPPVTPPVAPAVPAPSAPITTQQFGYEPQPTAPSPGTSYPADVSVPPTAPSSPVSPEAQRPTTTQAAAAPDPRQLPAGAPPLGFDGYCPVSMRKNWKWMPGDPKFGAIHRGRTYWFIGPAEQKEFLARPDYYSPALAGDDPVLAIDHRQTVPGLREHSLDYDGQFFLFSSEATLQQFTASPERYASGVRQAMGMPQGQQTR